MKYPKWYPRWTNPDWEMDEGFLRSSLILFTIRQGRDVVLASRCPTAPALPVGGSMIRTLDMPADVCAELLRPARDLRPMFILTRVGLGIIDRTYAQATGIYLYIHVHSRPRRLAALINGGALGDPTVGRFWISEDIRKMGSREGLLRDQDYGILADVWSDVEARRRGLLHPSKDGFVYRSQLQKLAEQFSRYVGCAVGFDGSLGERVSNESDGGHPVNGMRCYRPEVCEALLLCLLCEARRYAKDGLVRMGISTVTGQEGDCLSLSLGYTVDSASRFEKGRLMGDWIHQYLQLVAHTHGMGISVETEYPLEGRARYCRHPEIRVTVDWVRDPAVLESTDIKAGDRWLDEMSFYTLPPAFEV